MSLKACGDRILGYFGFLWVALWGLLGILLAAVGCLGNPLVIPGGSWGVPGRLGVDIWDFPGRLLASFSVLFWTSFFGIFLKRFSIDVGIIF